MDPGAVMDQRKEPQATKDYSQALKLGRFACLDIEISWIRDSFLPSIFSLLEWKYL